jgi:hypothetical protein
MRRWYFVPPIAMVALVGAFLAFAVRAFASRPAGTPPDRSTKVEVANASGLFTMTVGASFVWLFVLGTSRRRRLLVRVAPTELTVVDAGIERAIARDPAHDAVSVRRVPQYLDLPPRHCVAYGSASESVAAFTTFDARELEVAAAELGAALAKVPLAR